jgi:hypothetical protein
MSCPYTSPQNGKVERTLRTINNMICSLLFQVSFQVRYGVDGFHTATYLLNRLPSKMIRESYPYVALHDVAPSYEHLRVFGCAYYPNLSAQTPKNWHSGPPNVSFSDTLSTTKAIEVSISLPITSSSPDMLFLMRHTSPLLSRPV